MSQDFGYFLYETDWTGFVEGINRPVTRKGRAKPPPMRKRWYRTLDEALAAKARRRTDNPSPDLLLTVKPAPPPSAEARNLFDCLPIMPKRLTE